MARSHAASFSDGEFFGEEEVDLDFGFGKKYGFDVFRACSWPAAAPSRLRPEPPAPPSRKPSTADWEVPPLELPSALIPKRRATMPVRSPRTTFTTLEGEFGASGGSSFGVVKVEGTFEAGAAGNFDGDEDGFCAGVFSLDASVPPNESHHAGLGRLQAEISGFDDDQVPALGPSAAIAKRQSMTSMASPTASFTTTEGDMLASAGSSLVVPVVEESLEADAAVGDFDGAFEDDAGDDAVGSDIGDYRDGGDFQVEMIGFDDEKDFTCSALGRGLPLRYPGPTLLSALEMVAAQVRAASNS